MRQFGWEDDGIDDGVIFVNSATGISRARLLGNPRLRDDLLIASNGSIDGDATPEDAIIGGPAAADYIAEVMAQRFGGTRTPQRCGQIRNRLTPDDWCGLPVRYEVTSLHAAIDDVAAGKAASRANLWRGTNVSSGSALPQGTAKAKD